MLHGPQHVGAPVRPPQQGKETVVHALHAHGDAVDARSQIGVHGPAGQQGFGIGLHADLGPGRQMEMPVDTLQHGGLEVGRQQAGRTAAEKDALHRPSAQARGPKIQLAQQAVPVGRHPGRTVGRGRAQRQGVEGAVAAAGAAERDVDVDEHGGKGRGWAGMTAQAGEERAPGRQSASRLGKNDGTAYILLLAMATRRRRPALRDARSSRCFGEIYGHPFSMPRPRPVEGRDSHSACLPGREHAGSLPRAGQSGSLAGHRARHARLPGQEGPAGPAARPSRTARAARAGHRPGRP